MTSKENIELIKQLYEYAMYDFHCGELNEMTEKDKAVGKAIEQIEQDLEVLEILKNKIRISNDLDVRMLDYPLFLLPMRKEERDKIKEWLINDK